MKSTLVSWPVRSLLFAVCFLILFVSNQVLAESEKIEDAKVFTVSPTKLEIKLGPGESLFRNIYVTNKSGRDLKFKVGVEDMSNGRDEKEIVKFYGPEMGPYSIKNYTLVDSAEFVIKNGETKAVPVMFSLPYNHVAAGGLYGAVFFSTVSSGSSAARISTRVGSLIFIKTKEVAVERGQLKNFSLIGHRNIYNNNPVHFQAVYENTGDIYLNPYGYVEIKNNLTHKTVTSDIEPYFVFPNSTRMKEIVWANEARFGYFTANIYLNRGYNNSVDRRSFNFFVIPFDLFLSVLVLVLVLIFLYKAVLKFKNKKCEELLH